MNDNKFLLHKFNIMMISIHCKLILALESGASFPISAGNLFKSHEWFVSPDFILGLVFQNV